MPTSLSSGSSVVSTKSSNERFVSATTTVNFTETSDNLNLSLEYHVGPYNPAYYGKGTPIRQYPFISNFPGPVFACTRGTITIGEVRVEDVDELIEFSGSNTANVKRPKPSGVNISTTLASSTNPRIPNRISFDKEGHDVYPIVHYDYDNDQLVSNIAFYGAIRVTYQATYQVIYYLPDSQYTQLADGSLAVSTEWGTVFVFYNGSSAKMEVSCNVADTKDRVEYYRVVVTTVLDQDGSHEAPPNWPTSGDYGIQGVDDLDPDSSFTYDRAFEIGTVDKLGTVITIQNRFSTTLLDPYAGSGISWTPKYKVKWASVPDEMVWKHAFAAVNRNAVWADLQARWTGITQ